MTNKTIMENLHNYLPKELVTIVEEYSKDRTNYDKVVRELNKYILKYDWNSVYYTNKRLYFPKFIFKKVQHYKDKKFDQRLLRNER